MSVVAPPPHDELELLIREARARQHRRRMLIAAGVAAFAALGLALWAAIPGGRPPRPVAGGAGTPSAVQRIEAAARGRARIWNAGSTGGVTWGLNGRHLWVTDNGGRIWRAHLPPPFARDPAHVSEIQFIDRRQGWLWGEGSGLARTRNGGRTWQRLRLPDRIEGSAASFTFLNRSRGYLLAWPGELFVSRDGGSTWHAVSRLRLHFAELGFVDERRGFATGNHSVYATANGGRSWKVVLRTTTPNSELWAPAASGHRLVVPELVFPRNPDGPARVVVYVSDDGGSTWSARRVPALIPGPLDHDVGPPTIGFTALTPNDWVAQNWSRLLVTTDAGRSWRVIRPAGLPHRWVVVGAGFTSLRDGWALFAAPPAPGFIPMRTTDGGRHWAPAGPWLPKRHRR